MGEFIKTELQTQRERIGILAQVVRGVPATVWDSVPPPFPPDLVFWGRVWKMLRSTDTLL